MTFIKKYWYLVALFVIVFGLLFRNCGLDEDLKIMKERYETLEKEKEIADEQAFEEIGEKEKEIESLNEKIAEHMGHIDSLVTVIARKDETIESLEREEVVLSGDDTKKDALIANLRLQVGEWKEKFNLAERVIKEKDAIIFDMTKKYDAQVKISLDYEGLYIRERDLHNLAKIRLQVCEGRLRKRKLSSRIQSGVLIVLAGLVTYEIVSRN